MSLNNVKVVKKDGTKEEFNVQKVVVAVNKSAYRALIKFSQKDIDFICLCRRKGRRTRSA